MKITRSMQVATGLCLLLLVGIFFLSPTLTKRDKPTRFYPNLMQQLNDITSIQVATHDSTLTIEKGEKAWTIPSLHNYPADLTKVKALLFGMAELIPFEKKTNNPSLYKRLHLENINEKDSKGVQVVLTNKENKQLVDLIVGLSKPAKMDKSLEEVFVRKSQDKQTWLTVGSMPNYTTAVDWVNSDILEVDSTEIKSVTITREGKTPLVLAKDKPTDQSFKIQNLSDDTVVPDSFSADYLTESLGHLTLENILPRKDFKPDTPIATAKLLTYNDIEINYQLFEYKNNPYVLLEANYLKPENESDAALAIKAKVTAWQAEFSRWAYQIPRFQAAELKKTLDDFKSNA